MKLQLPIRSNLTTRKRTTNYGPLYKLRQTTSQQIPSSPHTFAFAHHFQHQHTIAHTPHHQQAAFRIKQVMVAFGSMQHSQFLTHQFQFSAFHMFISQHGSRQQGISAHSFHHSHSSHWAQQGGTSFSNSQTVGSHPGSWHTLASKVWGHFQLAFHPIPGAGKVPSKNFIPQATLGHFWALGPSTQGSFIHFPRPSRFHWARHSFPQNKGNSGSPIFFPPGPIGLGPNPKNHFWGIHIHSSRGFGNKGLWQISKLKNLPYSNSGQEIGQPFP